MSGSEKHINQNSIVNKHIYLIIFTISFIITLIVAIYYIESMPKVKFNQLSYKAYTSSEVEELVPLGKNHSPKIMSLKKIVGKDKYLLSFSNINGKSFATFKINAYKIRPGWYYVSDINNDGKKDVIVFSQRKDSVFISAFTPLKDSTLFSDKFVLVKPKRALHSRWYISMKMGGIIETDSAGKELVFSLYTSKAVYPRAIIAYNFSQQKISKQFNLLSYPTHIKLFDLNKDGRKEIVVSTISASTIKRLNDNNPYDFNHSWLIVLDENLKPIFSLKEPDKLSEIISDTLSTSKKNYIISAYRPSPKKNLVSQVLKVNAEGEVVKKVNFKHLRIINCLVADSNAIFYSFKDSLKVLDNNLNVIKNIKLPYNKTIISLKRFIFENSTYYLTWSAGKLYVFDSNYNLCLHRKIDYLEKNLKYDFSFFQESGNSPPMFLVGGRTERRILVIAPNHFSLNTFFIFFSMWIILSLVLTGGKFALQEVLIYYYYFLNSSTKSSSMIILIDNKERIRYVNKTAKKIFGEKGKALSHKSDYSVLSNVSRELYNFIDIGIHSLNELTSEFTLVTNEKIFRVKGTFIPFILYGRITIGYYCNLINLSKEIEVERAKVFSHSIQKVAHEIKTPLNSIIFILKGIELQYRSEENLDSEEVMTDLKQISNEVKRISTLTNNLLKFANLEKPHFQTVKIDKIFMQSISKFEGYKRKGIEFKLTGIMGEVFVDEFQMIEAFQVLIENSIDAMAGVGNIEIKSQKEIIDDIVYLKISISDEGEGIPEDIQNVLFDPYVTTKIHGTGMGLAIARKIIEDHGSEVKFVTGPNGTTFSFYLKCINC